MPIIDILWQNEEIRTLAPIWKAGLDVLFVGLNPSIPSVEAGHYHQGKLGKRFWKRLRSIGLLQGAQPGLEDEALLERNFGVTDLVPRPSARANEVTEEEFQLGKQFVLYQISEGKPRIVCFIYKKALEVLVGGAIPTEGGLIESEDEAWRSIFGGSRVFLFPGPYAQAETEKKILDMFKRLVGEVRGDRD
ncbi:MAG: uracil-DNA glycosylase family protein [Nitrospinota bacterium]